MAQPIRNNIHTFLMFYQVVLSSILPFYLEYIKNNDGVCDKKKESKDELTALQSLHCSVQVLLKSCNSLRR